MAALTLTGNAPRKSETEYHGKLGHTIGRIQHISLMSIIDICYIVCRLVTQTMAPTLPGFQGLKCCIKHIASHPHKPIVYPSNSYFGTNFIILTWIRNQVEY